MGVERSHECGREGIVAVCRRWCENVVSTGVVDLVEVVRLGVEAMIGVQDIASRRQRNTCQRCQRELTAGEPTHRKKLLNLRSIHPLSIAAQKNSKRPRAPRRVRG
jgi:hypothetical protein